MPEAPPRQEIEHRTIKLIIGLIAIFLSILTWLLSDPRDPLTSISAAYHQGGSAQTVFIGFLFAVAAFLLAYNGRKPPERTLSKIAGLCAAAVAVFPCEGPLDTIHLTYLHYPAAIVLFLILAFFAWRFYQRAREKLLADPTHIEAAHRARLYLACLAGMLAAMAMIAYGKLLNPAFKDSFPDYIFWGEATALTFFGISWLIASRTLWFLTRTGERFRPLRDHNPD